MRLPYYPCNYKKSRAETPMVLTTLAYTPVSLITRQKTYNIGFSMYMDMRPGPVVRILKYSRIIFIYCTGAPSLVWNKASTFTQHPRKEFGDHAAKDLARSGYIREIYIIQKKVFEIEIIFQIITDTPAFEDI